MYKKLINQTSKVQFTSKLKHLKNSPKYLYFKIHTNTTPLVKFKYINIKPKFRDIFLYRKMKQNLNETELGSNIGF